LINGINADDLRLEQGAGRLEIINSKFEKTRIEGGAGEMILNGVELNDLKLVAGVRKSYYEWKDYRKQQN